MPNRIALYLTAVGDLVAALVPFFADFGAPQQVVGYATAVLAANGVVITWLLGWQKYEERTDLERLEEPPEDPDGPVPVADEPGPDQLEDPDYDPAESKPAAFR